MRELHGEVASRVVRPAVLLLCPAKAIPPNKLTFKCRSNLLQRPGTMSSLLFSSALHRHAAPFKSAAGARSQRPGRTVGVAARAESKVQQLLQRDKKVRLRVQCERAAAQENLLELAHKTTHGWGGSARGRSNSLPSPSLLLRAECGGGGPLGL